MTLQADAAVSPDGSQLAFVAADSTGKEVLWVRSFRFFNGPSARGHGRCRVSVLVAGRSLDRLLRHTVFAGRSSLKKIDVSGGPPIAVASAIAGKGGTWNQDDVIVFGTGATRLLYRVSAAGGQVVPITKESETVTVSRGGVHFLPDGNHYLYDGPDSGNGRAVYVAALESDSGKPWWKAEKVPPINKGGCCIFAVALLSRNHSMRSG